MLPSVDFCITWMKKGFIVGNRGTEHPSEPQEQHGQETSRLLQRLLIIFSLPLGKYNILSVREQFKLVHFTQ